MSTLHCGPSASFAPNTSTGALSPNELPARRALTLMLAPPTSSLIVNSLPVMLTLGCAGDETGDARAAVRLASRATDHAARRFRILPDIGSDATRAQSQ